MLSKNVDHDQRMCNLESGSNISYVFLPRCLATCLQQRPRTCWKSGQYHLKAKEKYRGMFEIQKSGDKTSSGEIGIDIRTLASPKVGQDQVQASSVGMPHPLHMFYGNLSQLVKKVTVKNWCNVLSMEGVTVCGHHPECRVTFGRGGGATFTYLYEIF